jgi:hypothetical protein
MAARAQPAAGADRRVGRVGCVRAALGRPLRGAGEAAFLALIPNIRYTSARVCGSWGRVADGVRVCRARKPNEPNFSTRLAIRLS